MGTKITATREQVFRLQAASEDDTIFLICNVLFGGQPDANRVLDRSWLQPGAVFIMSVLEVLANHQLLLHCVQGFFDVYQIVHTVFLQNHQLLLW